MIPVGLRRRPQFMDLLQEIQIDPHKIRYPNRDAKRLRDGFVYSQFDEENNRQMLMQQLNVNAQEQSAAVFRMAAAQAGVPHASFAAAFRQPPPPPPTVGPGKRSRADDDIDQRPSTAPAAPKSSSPAVPMSSSPAAPMSSSSSSSQPLNLVAIGAVDPSQQAAASASAASNVAMTEAMHHENKRKADEAALRIPEESLGSFIEFNPQLFENKGRKIFGLPTHLKNKRLLTVDHFEKMISIYNQNYPNNLIDLHKPTDVPKSGSTLKNYYIAQLKLKGVEWQ